MQDDFHLFGAYGSTLSIASSPKGTREPVTTELYPSALRLEYHHPINGEGVLNLMYCILTQDQKNLVCVDPHDSSLSTGMITILSR